MGKLARGNDIPHPKTRRKTFRQTAYVNYATMAIQAFQRRRGCRVVAVFGFEVVFNNNAVATAGNIEQGLAPFHRQRNTGGALVAGRHEDVVARLQCRRNAKAFVVNRQRHHALRAMRKNVAGVWVARVFHAQHRMLVNQQIGQQIQSMLRANSDNDLFFLGPDTTTWQYLGADFFDKSGVVTGDQVGRPTTNIKH